jgi:hypothetical protein
VKREERPEPSYLGGVGYFLDIAGLFRYNPQMNGKGDRPRNNFSDEFRSHFDEIDWRKFYVFEYGRPIGMDPQIRRMTKREVEKAKRDAAENCPYGCTIHEFGSEKEAQDFVNGVQTETSNT